MKQLNKSIISSAKKLVGYVEDEKVSIDLMNRLSGIEKEIDAEELWKNRYFNMLHEIVGNYNSIFHDNLFIREDNSPEYANSGFEDPPITLCLAIYKHDERKNHTKTIYCLHMRTLKSHKEIFREHIYRDMVQFISINGLSPLVIKSDFK